VLSDDIGRAPMIAGSGFDAWLSSLASAERVEGVVIKAPNAKFGLTLSDVFLLIWLNAG